MQFNSHKARLLAPGPVPVDPRVLDVLSEQVIHHRTPEFESLLSHTLNNLKKVFQTKNPCMIHASTGSGAMESAIVNTLSPGDHVVAVCFGKFGDRWADIAEGYGINTHRISGEWGSPVEVKAIEEKISELKTAGHKVSAVLCQACETSTGTLHPIQELGELLKDTKTLLLVDAITALGALDMPMDDWHLDVVIGGSQKAFGLPTGMSFISLSDKAWQAYEKAKCPRYYFDLGPEKAANIKNQTRFSSAVSLIKALDESLKITMKEGLGNQFLSVSYMAKSFRDAIQDFGLPLFGKNPSPSLTVLKLPDSMDGVKLRDVIESKYGVTFIGGQEHLKGKILRIGHMGFLEMEDYQQAIEALGLGLIDCGMDLKKESIDAAVNLFTLHISK